jgi:hypothetical protein
VREQLKPIISLKDGDEISVLYEDKIRESRRISAIKRREIADDNLDVRAYLEELKAGGNPQKKGSAPKIIEENEDEQSDSSIAQTFPRKSAISTNTVKSPDLFGDPINTGFHFHNSVANSMSPPVQIKEEKQEDRTKKSRISKQLDLLAGPGRFRDFTFKNHTTSTNS